MTDEKYKICATCVSYSAKIYYGGCENTEGKCFIDHPPDVAWVKNKDTCDRHEFERQEYLDFIIPILEEATNALNFVRENKI